MSPGKIISVIEIYQKHLSRAGVPKMRANINKTFGELSKEELLAHAHYLCDGIRVYAKDPNKKRKTGSHLTAIQMCLSFAGWYTLKDLMNHNKPN